MDGYVNVVERRMDDLIKICIQERKSKGFGVLFLNFTEENVMNCFYITIDDEKFPNNVKKNILERRQVAPDSMVYLYIYNDKEERILEIDLDKNSNFHEKTNKNFSNVMN
jgi:hypothetical protein